MASLSVTRFTRLGALERRSFSGSGMSLELNERRICASYPRLTLDINKELKLTISLIESPTSDEFLGINRKTSNNRESDGRQCSTMESSAM